MTTGSSDRELLEFLRSGEDDAYAELWRRHHPAALRAARQYDHSGEAEDIAAEAFARVLDAVRRGNGPTEAFRAYLLRAVSHVAQNAARTRRRQVLSGDQADLDSPVVEDDPAIEALEQLYVARAFERLTQPQKEILWYVEVERTPTKDAAVLMGLSANAAAAVAGRAREALRREYLQLHVEDHGSEPGCKAALDKLGGYIRGSLTAMQHKRVDEHVEDCAKCSLALAELREVGAVMRTVLGPIVLGPAAVGYLALASEEAVVGGIIGGTGAGAASGAGGGAPTGGVGRVVRTSGAAAAAVLVLAAIAAGAVMLTSGEGDKDPVSGGGGGGNPPPAVSDDGPAPPPSEQEQDDPKDPKDPAPNDPSEPEPSASDPSPSDSPSDRPSSPAPTSGPDPTPTPRPTPRPTPTPSPTPTPTPSPTPTPTPTPKPLEIEGYQLTGPVWESDERRDYVVVAVDGAEPGSRVTVRMGSAPLAHMSKASGSVPPRPPLVDDGAWKCTGFGVVVAGGQECVGTAGRMGQALAAIETTRPFSLLGTPYGLYAQATAGGNELDQTIIPVE